MIKLSILFLFLSITAILLTGSLVSGNAFAASDDDQHDGNVSSKNRVWTGDGPPGQNGISCWNTIAG